MCDGANRPVDSDRLTGLLLYLKTNYSVDNMQYSDTIECKMHQHLMDEVIDDNNLFTCLYFEHEINSVRERLIKHFWGDCEMVTRIERDYRRARVYMIPGGDFELDDH